MKYFQEKWKHFYILFLQFFPPPGNLRNENVEDPTKKSFFKPEFRCFLWPAVEDERVLLKSVSSQGTDIATRAGAAKNQNKIFISGWRECWHVIPCHVVACWSKYQTVQLTKYSEYICIFFSGRSLVCREPSHRVQIVCRYRWQIQQRQYGCQKTEIKQVKI